MIKKRIASPNLKSPRKRRTPTKAQRAMANTHKIMHYFSPKSTSKSSTNSTPLHMSVDKRCRALAMNSASSVSSIRRCSPQIRTQVSKAVVKLQFLSEGTTGATRPTRSSKKNISYSLSSSDYNVKKEDILKIGRIGSSEQNVPSRSMKRKTLSNSKVEEGSDASHSSSSDEILSFSPFSKKIKIGASSKSETGTSILSNGLPLERSERIKSEEQDPQDSEIRPNQIKHEKLLGLIRIDPNLTLHEICRNLEVEPEKQTVYHIHAGVIIGRESGKKKGSLDQSNKVSLGIPAHEIGVSRRQLKVLKVHPPSQGGDQIIESLEHKLASGYCVNRTWSQHQFEDMCQCEECLIYHCEYLKEKPRTCHTIEVQCPPDTANPIRVHRLDLNRECIKSRIIEGGPLKPDYLTVSTRLVRTSKILLRVGDAIEFDVYNAPPIGPVSNGVNDTGTNYRRVHNMKPTGRYVYRLVCYAQERFDDSKKEERIVGSLAIPRPFKITPESSTDNGSKTVALGRRMKEEESSSLCESVLNNSPSHYIHGSNDSIPNIKSDSYMDSNMKKHSKMDRERPPRIGDSIRVVNLYMNDLFKDQGKLLWTLGVVTDLEMGRDGVYSLNVKYSDGLTDNQTYPHEDVDIIVPKENSLSTINTLSGSFAYDSNPSSLLMGDYVECYYQNGKDNGRWWQGRITFVSIDGSYANVAYFDGQIEVGVPMDMSYIRLISRGSFCANNWLSGVHVSDNDSESSNRVFEVIRVYTKNEVDPDLKPDKDCSGEMWCELIGNDGVKSERTYKNVVKSVFSALRSDNKSKIMMSWPGYTPVKNASVSLIVNGRKSVLTPCCTKHKINEREDELSENLLETHDEGLECESSTIWMDQLPNVDLESVYPYEGVLEERNPNDKVETERIMSEDSLDDDISQSRRPLISTMKPVLSNACWRTLNSAEVQNGFGILTHLESSWNAFPTAQIVDLFAEFLSQGAEYEGKSINVPHRTEMVFTYINLLKNSFYDEKRRVGATICSNLEDFLSLPARATNHDDERASVLHQTAQYLQFCSKSLRFVAQSLSGELKDTIRDIGQPTSPSMCYGKSFISQFLMIDLNNSLKMAVRSAIGVLMRYGHWTNEGAVKTADEQLCAKESQSCVNALGTIVCHIAFLFCLKEEISFANNRCCRIIEDAACYAINNFGLSSKRTNRRKTAWNDEKGKFKKDLMLRFILSLDTSYSRALQLELSQLFDVSDDIALVLG